MLLTVLSSPIGSPLSTGTILKKENFLLPGLKVTFFFKVTLKSKLHVSQNDTASHGGLLSSGCSSNEATLPGSASLANKVRRIATISTFILRG